MPANSPQSPALTATDTQIVTVLIRAYNRRDKTLRAVRSALQQTLSGQPIIVVDDASTDGTAEAVMQTFGKRVQLVRRTENGGPGAAANTGLAAVEMPFVAFLDSDDEWHPLFLERLVGALQSNPHKSLAYCDYRRRFEEQTIDLPMRCAAAPRYLESGSDLLHTMSVVVARTRALQALGRLREDLLIGEDQDLAFRLWLRSPDGFIHLSDRLVYYSFGGDNVTGDYDRFLADSTRLVNEKLRQPILRHLRGQRNELIRQRFLSITERRHLARWVSATPKRTASLIVPYANDADLLRQTLESAAEQRQPPLEAVVVFPKDAKLSSAIQQDWPFPVHPIPLDQARSYRDGLSLALAACSGELVTFLEAGDCWAEGALDAHRRAFSCTMGGVQFSYGAPDDVQTPISLTEELEGLAYQAIRHNTPGTLSVMAIDRKRLSSLRYLPTSEERPLWLALVLRLAMLDDAVPVRLQRSLLKRGTRSSLNATNALGTLAVLAETDPGRALAALHDAAEDDWLTQGRLFADACDAPQGFEPLW